MVIFSQDKTQILNFDNIQNVRIDTYGTHIKGKKIYKIFSGNFEGYATELGTYNTEERAKEVLQKIVSFYERSKENDMSSVKFYLEDAYVFRMPEE